jgi:hypothetical protein
LQTALVDDSHRVRSVKEGNKDVNNKETNKQGTRKVVFIWGHEDFLDLNKFMNQNELEV